MNDVHLFVLKCDRCKKERKTEWVKDGICRYCKGNETYRKNGYKHSEETKRKIGKGHKGKIVLEKSRQKMSESHKGKKLSQESIDKRTKTRKDNGYVHSEETKLKIGNGNRGKKFTNEHKQNLSKGQIGRIVSEETRKKLSITGKGRIVLEETRKKISESQIGSNNNMWNGGSSFELYGIEFNNELRRYIRNRDGNKCIECGEEYNDGIALAVHHIDYCKTNNCERNLCALCKKHHSKTNINRDYWTKYFQKYINNLYDNVILGGSEW